MDTLFSLVNVQEGNSYADQLWRRVLNTPFNFREIELVGARGILGGLGVESWLLTSDTSFQLDSQGFFVLFCCFCFCVCVCGFLSVQSVVLHYHLIPFSTKILWSPRTLLDYLGIF